MFLNIITVMIGATVAIATSSLVGMYSNLKEEKAIAKQAEGIIDSSQYLQRTRFETSSLTTSQMLKKNKIPISMLVVDDGTNTEEEINLFSKEYEATMVLLDSYPSLTDSEITCSLLSNTGKITLSECNIVHGKQFKLYQITENDIRFNIAKGKTKLQNYVASIEARRTFSKKEDVKIVSLPDGTKNLMEPNFNAQNVAQIKKEVTMEYEAKKQIQELLNRDEIRLAGSKIKKLSEKSENSFLLISLNQKLKTGIAKTSKSQVDIEMANTDMAQSFSLIYEKVKKKKESSGVESAALLNTEMLSISQSVQDLNVTTSGNTVINDFEKSRFNTNFN